MSLRPLYLIFKPVLGLLLLLSRTSATKDVELLVLRQRVQSVVAFDLAESVAQNLISSEISDQLN